MPKCRSKGLIVKCQASRGLDYKLGKGYFMKLTTFIQKQVPAAPEAKIKMSGFGAFNDLNDLIEKTKSVIEHGDAVEELDPTIRQDIKIVVRPKDEREVASGSAGTIDALNNDKAILSDVGSGKLTPDPLSRALVEKINKIARGEAYAIPAGGGIKSLMIENDISTPHYDQKCWDMKHFAKMFRL